MKGEEALSGLQITSAAFIFIPHLLRAMKVYVGRFGWLPWGSGHSFTGAWSAVKLGKGRGWRRSSGEKPLALAPDGLYANHHA